MDRTAFLERAAPYYALAIAMFFDGVEDEGRNVSQQAIVSSWGYDDFEIGYVDPLEVHELFERGIKICEDAGLIEVISDEFGPRVYLRARTFDGAFKRLQEQYDVFRKVNRLTSARAWLQSALIKIAEQHRTLPDVPNEPSSRSEIDWNPIPIERDDPAVSAVVNALDETIEAVRANNGYNATYSEESRYVTDKLSAVRKRLKEDTQISWMYLKAYALEPLGLLIKRFGAAAIGLLAQAARAAVKDWLKKRGIDLLDSHFGRSRGKPVFSVQYHPEASPGPRDSRYLFERFVGLMKERKRV